MTLAEVCEPLFQYVCLLNRSARTAEAYGQRQVRAQLEAIFADMQSKSRAGRDLAAQYDRTEPVLVFFADFLIRQSALDFASDWQNLAADRGEQDGDEKFFDLLDETLRDPTPAATERLGIFYTCLGLGFTGWYAGQPEILRKRMRQVAARLRLTEDAINARIVPEAYEHTNTSNLITPPGRSVVGIGVALVGLVGVLFAANVYLYHKSSKDLNTAIDELSRSVETTAR
jgi:type VI secretion system protein ImpK